MAGCGGKSTHGGAGAARWRASWRRSDSCSRETDGVAQRRGWGRPGSSERPSQMSAADASSTKCASSGASSPASSSRWMSEVSHPVSSSTKMTISATRWNSCFSARRRCTGGQRRLPSADLRSPAAGTHSCPSASRPQCRAGQPGPSQIRRAACSPCPGTTCFLASVDFIMVADISLALVPIHGSNETACPPRKQGASGVPPACHGTTDLRKAREFPGDREHKSDCCCIHGRRLLERRSSLARLKATPGIVIRQVPRQTWTSLPRLKIARRRGKWKKLE